VIASNAYDLAPLAELLGEVAKAYPNAFPRKVRSTGPTDEGFEAALDTVAAGVAAKVEKRAGRRKSMF
jgi:hypothetical protein